MRSQNKRKKHLFLVLADKQVQANTTTTKDCCTYYTHSVYFLQILCGLLEFQSGSGNPAKENKK